VTRVACVLLAAGGSRRLGEPKQLLRLAGQPLVRRAALAALASCAERVLVVTGAHAERVEAALAGLALECVRSASWESGLAASLRVGVSAALARDPDAGVLVLLADQPAVSAPLLDALIALRRAGKMVAACEYGGEPGVPAIFASHLARELLALEGDRGAKALLLRERARAALVPFPDGALDVDTPEDWARASRILGAELERQGSRR
jgi:molybdenum cofactor cytidylyltransferase